MTLPATIKLSKVPEYLRSSELFRTFEGTDDEISIPSDCFKRDVTVHNASDLRHLLSTLRFWIVSNFPQTLINYLIQCTMYRNKAAEVKVILLEFESAFRGVSGLVAELSASPRAPDLVCNIAAKYGRVDFLKYFSARNKPFNIHTLLTAAVNGHLQCVQHIYLDLRARSSGRPNILSNVNCSEVVQRGHLGCLVFLIHHGLQIEPDNWSVMAVRHNQMATLQYVLTNYPSHSEYIATEAVTQNNVRMLECAVKHGCEVTVRTWRAAMSPQNYDCLQLLLKSFPAMLGNPEILVPSVACASWKTLELLMQHGFCFSPGIAAFAAKEGNMECIEFIHHRVGLNCYIPSTMTGAASGNKIGVVKALHERGCWWDESAPIAAVRVDAALCFTFFLEQRGVPRSAEYHALPLRPFCKIAMECYLIHVRLEELRRALERISYRREHGIPIREVFREMYEQFKSGAESVRDFILRR